MRPAKEFLAFTLFTLVSFGVFTAPTEAAFIIDEFTTNQTALDSSSAGGPVVNSLGSSSNVTIGQRDLFAQKLAPPDPSTAEVTSESLAFEGIYRFDQEGSSSTRGLGWIVYDGGTTPANPDLPTMGLGGLDLTQGGVNTGLLFNEFTVNTANPPNSGLTLSIALWNAGTVYTYTEPNLAATMGSNKFISFLAFLGAPAAHFTSIDAIVIKVDGTAGQGDDLEFTQLQATSVPEPATALLWSIGAFGLVATRRFRRR